MTPLHLQTSAAFDVVVLGASAGALKALRVVLPAIPADLAAAVVVHVSADHPSRMAEVLSSYLPRPLKEAEDKERLAPGAIFLAPPGYHLLVETDGTLALSQDEPVHFSRPSIDALFESAADAFGARTLAILMTGANDDGASGIAAIAERGGTTIVQDPREAESPFMPESAIKLTTPTHVLTLEAIAKFLGGLSPKEPEAGLGPTKGGADAP